MKTTTYYIISKENHNWYISRVEGIYYVTWVNIKHKNRAMTFTSLTDVEKYIEIISQIAEIELEITYHSENDW